MTEKGHLIYIERIYNKHFRKFKNLKDDLLQEGYLEICKRLKTFDKNKGNFYAYVKKPIYNAMLKFIKKEKVINNNICSYDDVIFNDNESVNYLDLLKDIKQENFNFIDLKRTIETIKSNFTPKQEIIIDDFLCGYSQTEIAERVNSCKQYVNHTIKRFREELKLVL